MKPAKRYSWDDFKSNKETILEQMRDTSVSYIFVAFIVLISLVTFRTLSKQDIPLGTILLLLCGIILFIVLIWGILVKMKKATFHPFSLSHNFRLLYKEYLAHGDDIVRTNLTSNHAWWGSHIDSSNDEVGSHYYLRVVCKEEDVSFHQDVLMDYLETHFKDALAFEDVYFDILLNQGTLLSLPEYPALATKYLREPLHWEFLEACSDENPPLFNQYEYGIMVNQKEYYLPHDALTRQEAL